MNFLSAQWNHLILANYSINPEKLKPYLPLKTQLDIFEGHCFLSLVAFMFNDTKILGLPIPGHINFEEVNLRFYVKPEYDTSIRGVSFIKELVPKKVIPLIANGFFYENYQALAMDHKHKGREFCYQWIKEGREHSFEVELKEECHLPITGSIGEFITEHYWGYAQAPKKTLEYKVEHPQWYCASIQDYRIDIDFRSTYGEAFAFLQDLEPFNVQYAVGSEVTVSFPKKL